MHRLMPLPHARRTAALVSIAPLGCHDAPPSPGSPSGTTERPITRQLTSSPDAPTLAQPDVERATGRGAALLLTPTGP